MLREIEFRPAPGLAMLFLFLLADVAAIPLIIKGAGGGSPGLVAGVGLALLVATIFGYAGLFTVAPNESKVLTLFGTYKGTVLNAGLWFANPFLTKQPVSLRVRNFETNKLKVNDARANPLEIGAIVVWKVIDTAEAMFEVNDYVQYAVSYTHLTLPTKA